MINLGDKFDMKLFENQVRDYYDNSQYKNNIYSYLNNPKNFVSTIGFVDGPPTMNGEPHLGHIRGRIIKDMWYRKSTLQKKRMIFRPGWDTQGLPVELQAEKILGLTGNKTENLRKVGIEKMVETCKKIILDYNMRWIKVDDLLGMSFDFKNGYWTYLDSYIEREWKYVRKAFEDGILKEWFRVVAYCPSCQTSLSNAEINQSYEQVEDPSFYYKVKLEKSDLNLIVWTTMPFTLVTDELIGVNPQAKYLIITVKRNDIEEKWVISEDRLKDLTTELKIDTYQVLDSVYGKELDGRYYIHPIIDNIPSLKEMASKKTIHFVVAEDFVDVTTGSGIVHLSPANGEQDFEIATKRDIPIFVPIDDRVCFTEEAGKYKNLFVRDADKIIVDDITRVGATIKISKLLHKYPTCWRSHHKVVWLARKEYFYMINELAEKPLEAAGKVNYYYEQPKNRFLEIIKEKVPWCISRERVWGTPLPIWKCSKCSHKKGLFSRKEIVEAATHLPYGKDFELHRPWIDEVIIPCPNCEIDMEREPYVLDTWHNSGSAPYSSFNDDEYQDLVPAEFLTEGIDQTRGWAYTLLMLNVLFSQSSQSPFKSFLFTGHVLDEKGNKMSKSLGNVVDAYSLLNNTSVDLVRLYLIWKSSPIEAINFNIKELSSRPHQILSTLFYLHVYYNQNSTYDRFNSQILKKDFLTEDRELLNTTDKWILTKLEKLISNTTDSLDTCRFHESAHYIEDFIINSLSQTYVPLIRYDLWSDDEKNQKRRFTIYKVLLKCLKTIDILLHPICPYITEYLYQSCFKDFDSILMEKWPQGIDFKEFSNKKIEEAFDIMKEISSLSFSLRNKSHLKRRWPLESAYIFYNSKEFLTTEGIYDILLEQMNIDNIVIDELIYSNEVQKILKLLEFGAPIIPFININRKSVAKTIRSDINILVEKFEKVDKLDVLKELNKNGVFHFNYELDKSIDLMITDLLFSYQTKENFIIGEKDNLILILNTSRNDSLILKGVIKDLARNIQQLRKELGYNPTHILNEVFISNLSQDEINKLKEFSTDIKNLVRVNQIIFSQNTNNNKELEYKQIELDGKEIQIYIH